jgi:hypothetical protein
MTDGGLTGGQLARLDELESVTREHARASQLALGEWTAVAIGCWALIAEAVSLLSVAAGGVTHAAGILVVAIVLRLERRSQRLKWTPGDAFERKVASVPWRRVADVLLMVSGSAMVALMLEGAVHNAPGEMEVRVAASAVAVSAAVGLLGSIFLLRLGEVGLPASTGLAVITLAPAQIGAVSLTMPWLGWERWRLFAALCALTALALLVLWNHRRKLAHLDRRVAFLKEHAR